MSSIQLKRWTRDQYDRLVTAGILAPDERVELLEREIVQMSPQSPLHAVTVRAGEGALRAAFDSDFDVRVRMPFLGWPMFEPEPDIAVVPGHRRDYPLAHPATAVLLVEVSDSSLDDDRRRKGLIYARAGVPEYWIVNLVDRVLEVYREPTPTGYANRSILCQGEAVSPPVAPHARIAVSALLP